MARGSSKNLFSPAMVGRWSCWDLSPFLNIKWLYCLGLSNTAQQKNNRSPASADNIQFCQIIQEGKATVLNWDICYYFSWKSCRDFGIKPCHFSTAYKRNSDVCSTFLSFTTRRKSAQLLPLYTFDLPTCRTTTAHVPFSAQKHLSIWKG